MVQQGVAETGVGTAQRSGTSLGRSRFGRRWKLRPNFVLPPDLLSERNAGLMLCMAVMGALATTVAHGQIFSAFIFELYGDNKSVGFIESMTGAISFLCAFPVGLAVDRIPRSRLLHMATWLGLLAAVTGTAAVAMGATYADNSVNGVREKPGTAYTALLLTSLAFWGFFFCSWTSAGEALFADSVPEGFARQQLYATKTTLVLITLAAGPLIAMCFTSILGNDWNLHHMVWMILPGFAVIIPMCVLTSSFEEVQLPTTEPVPEDAEAQPAKTTAELQSREGHQSADPSIKTVPVPQKFFSQLDLARQRPGAWLVPYLLMLGDLITAIGAGMTVKFFGLWFKNDHQFSPLALSALQAATPLAIMVAVQALQAAAKASPVGPVPAVLVFWISSIVALLAMAHVTDVRLLTVLHLVRSALANCKEPISKAILADFVPSNQRGRWNAAHSVTSVTWTGSAALGGILCDRYGYGRTFVLTAGLYVAAVLCWVPLMFWVPRYHPEEAKPCDAKKGAGKELAESKVKGA